MTVKEITLIESIKLVTQHQDERNRIRDKMGELNSMFFEAAEDNDEYTMLKIARMIKHNSNKFVKVQARLSELEQDHAIILKRVKYEEGA